MRRYKLLWFLLPGFILYAVFQLFPICSAFYYSITNWDGLTPSYAYVGFENYKRLASDIVFHTALINNLKFMVVVVLLQSGMSLLFALYLVKHTKTNVVLRALYFFPTILSSVSVAFIWLFMYDPSIGLISKILRQNWLGDKEFAIYAVALVQVWFHTGQMIVIFVSGLQAVPAELHEVATLEGANRWQRFRWVTWPLIAPAAAIVVSYTILQSFKAFDLIFAMTRGGPNYGTEILSTYIYASAFQNYSFGYASALSVVFMLVVALVTLLQFQILRVNRVHY
ncbi:carbohydrate ABC transporter permease [Ectobacillus antri]|uniref:carbohydrate ABC transporter permease n=1 Tax=Ectobacillus antri TaxID=2486280 RepID=UPI000F59F217|nr:sugar ABC transporter permease [Ectobacillus antri]